MSDSCKSVKYAELDKTENYVITSYRAGFLSFCLPLAPFASVVKPTHTF